MASDSEEEGYEIEYVQEARVVKKGRGKKATLDWEFLVRWKNFGPEDDTWEPIANFQQHDTIDTFWAKAGDPRDVYDLSKFKEGEKFIPVGPPRRKLKKRGSTDKAESPSQAAAAKASHTPPPSSPKEASPEVLDISDLPTGKRRRGPLDATPKQRPSKRKRDEAPTSTNGKTSARISARIEKTPQSASAKRTVSPRKKARDPSPELVPDSDEEAEMEVEMVVDKARSMSSEPPRVPPSPPASEGAADPLFDEDHPDNKLPAHRLRAKNPRVKPFEDPALKANEGISAKARAASGRKQASGSSSSAKSKPGPGRSSAGIKKKPTASVLTASKGKLRSVKGNHRVAAEQEPIEIDDDDDAPGAQELVSPVEPPTGDEILAAAGLNHEEADALPDFEETEAAVEPAAPTDLASAKEDEDAKARALKHAESLSKAAESIFPTAATQSVETKSSWNRSTIFDPITVGTSSSAGLPSGTDANQPAAPFSLNLDANTSIPVLFSDAHPSGSRLVPDITVSHANPAGQFYLKENAGALLDAVRSLGIAGRVTVSKDASEDLKTHFQRFSERLQNGELFVATAGIQFYAFCSSSSTVLCTRMNVARDLQVAERQIIVCKVAVDNYSGYTEAIGKVDPRRWSQYVASLV